MTKRYKPQPWVWLGDDPSEVSGLFYQEASPTPDDYVNAVRIMACSDAGGPRNLYVVACGSIYFDPKNMDAALSCVDIETGHFAIFGDLRKKFETEFAARLFIAGQPGFEWEFTTVPNVARVTLVSAFVAYAGLDIDQSYVVRVGPAEEDLSDNSRDCWNPKPDVIIRGGSSIKNYVKKEYC